MELAFLPAPDTPDLESIINPLRSIIPLKNNGAKPNIALVG